MPGGFHPFHAGHAALYQSAVKAFPDADVYVAASNDTSERPFPFAIKEKLARVAGVPPGRFVQVKSPFTSEEITSKYDPNSTILIFVKSEKNSKNGADPEGPFPAEVDPSTGKLPVVTRGPRKGQPVSDRLQYYKGNEKNLQPMSQHSYLAYLPTVKFGPGITSASEIRAAWPKLNDKRKTAMVMSLYPETQKNPKLAQNVVKMLDMGMGGQEGVTESYSNTTFQTERRRLNVPGLIKAGALFVTYPHGEQGWETDNQEDWAYSLISLYNVMQGGWPGEAKKYLKPASYKKAEQQINSSAPNLGSDNLVYDGKYNQILWSIKKLGIPDNVAFLDDGQQGVAEGKQIWDGTDWGPQGNFAGDTPVNLGGQTVNKLQVGDIVTYFGQKARIEAMSKTGNTSRITIANKMGATTKDVLTSDLKRTGVVEENGGAGGGFGTNYPGTYEEENGPFTHKGGLKLTSLTTESVDYLDEK